VGQLIHQEIGGLVQVGPVLGTQGALRFQLAQALEDLGVLEGVAAFDGGLVGVGPGFPLLAELALVLLDLVQQLARFGGRDRLPDRIGQVLLGQGQGEIVAFEVQLGVGRGRFAAETLLFDGFDLADAVLGMVYGIAFSNVDGTFLYLSEVAGDSRARNAQRIQ
jgi:hypothetical protein